MNVFISYHHTTLDERLAEALARALASAGFEVFFDRELRAGDKWSQGIQAQLEASDALIVLVSRESADRPMVQREVKAAYEISKERAYDLAGANRRGQDSLRAFLPGRVPASVLGLWR